MVSIFIKTYSSARQKRIFRALVARSLEALPASFQKKLPKTLAVIFVSPSFSHALNKKYRKKDKPANVLSFVYPVRSPIRFYRIGKRPQRLTSNGVYDEHAEIFITPAVVRKEAAAEGEVYAFRLAKMIIHGIIHCGGIDHERSEREAEKAERLELTALKNLSF